MTIFNEQKEQNQGTWFPYFGSHLDIKTGKYIYDDPVSDAAEFCIRNLAPFYTERLTTRKKEHAVVLNPSTRSMERISYYEDLTPEDAKKELEDAWDYAIMGIKRARWTVDGPEMECTRENKLKLKNDEEFNRFLLRCFKMLSGMEKEEAEALPKN